MLACLRVRATLDCVSHSRRKKEAAECQASWMRTGAPPHQQPSGVGGIVSTGPARLCHPRADTYMPIWTLLLGTGWSRVDMAAPRQLSTLTRGFISHHVRVSRQTINGISYNAPSEPPHGTSCKPSNPESVMSPK